jgi:uncharacterized protein HemX
MEKEAVVHQQEVVLFGMKLVGCVLFIIALILGVGAFFSGANDMDGAQDSEQALGNTEKAATELSARLRV